MELFSAYIIIVGLLSNYMSLKKADESQSFDDFQKWLTDKNHTELLAYILENHKVAVSVENLLKKNHQSISDGLKILNDNMMFISSQIEGLKDITAAIDPLKELSEQSISILQQLHDSGGKFFFEIINNRWGNQYPIDHGGNINYNDSRFIDDDLKKLVELGFLNLEYNSKGSKVFYYTRKADQYIKFLFGE